MARTPNESERPTKKARIETNAKKNVTHSESSSATLKPHKKAIMKKGGSETGGPPTKNKGKAKETNSIDAESGNDLPSTFKIVAGSYEKLLYGIEGKTTYSESTKLKFHLQLIFAFPAHVSCIKAVAASPNGGKWLATGSADEIIKVWDLRRRKEIGGLMHHEGSITHLTFPSRSHLFSASEDGTLCLFRARDWAVLRALRGHKGRVNSMSVHPSGKVALSVGKDKALRMWDLMRGRGVASTKIGKEGEIVRWSVDGNIFAIQSGSTIDVYNTEMTLLHTIQHSSRIHDIKFCKRVAGKGEVLLVGAEDKKLTVYDIFEDSSRAPEIIARMIGHRNRVKAVETLRIALPLSSGRTSTTIVTTISSDGKICVYDMYSIPATMETAIEITPVTEYDTKGTRLTCVTLADGGMESIEATNGKRKQDEDSNDDAGSEEDDVFRDITPEGGDDENESERDLEGEEED